MGTILPKTMAHYDFLHLCRLLASQHPVIPALDTAPIIAIAQPEGPAIIAVDVDDVAGPLFLTWAWLPSNVASNVAGKSPT